jgi:shikimate 5-dehydrogenase
VLDSLPPGRTAILGDGGAATAFAEARPDAARFSRRGAWPPEVVGFDVVVNATSEPDDVVVELTAGQTLVDVPYPRTATADAAERNGATVVDGLEVLAAQGAAAFTLWTRVPAPLDLMLAAVRSA